MGDAGICTCRVLQGLKGKPVQIRHGRATVKRVIRSNMPLPIRREGGTVHTRKSGDLPVDLARFILRGKGYGYSGRYIDALCLNAEPPFLLGLEVFSLSL